MALPGIIEHEGLGQKVYNVEATDKIVDEKTEWEVIAPVPTPRNIFVHPDDDETGVIVKWNTQIAPEYEAYLKLYEDDAPEPILTKKGTSAVSTATNVKWHCVNIEDIDPSKTYSYEISSDGENWSAKRELITADTSGKVVFGVVSDIHAHTGMQAGQFSVPNTVEQGWKDCVSKMLDKDVKYVLAAGDNVDQGNKAEEYDVLSSPSAMSRLPFAFAVGNHDGSFLFLERLTYPNYREEQNLNLIGNYWFRHKNVLTVVLNTAGYPSNLLGAAEYITYFENTFNLAKAAHSGNYDWLVVVHHKSTTSIAAHMGDGDIQKFVEAGLERLMTEQGVDIVFTGHDHVRVNSQLVAWDNTAGGKGASVPSATGTYYCALGSSSGSKFYNHMVYEPEWGPDNTEYPYLADGTWGVVDSNGVKQVSVSNPPMTFGEYDPTEEPDFSIVYVEGLTLTAQSYDFAGNAVLSPITITKL